MENKNNPWELTLRDTINNLFRQKKIIMLIFFTVIISTIIGLQFKTPLYDANVKMLIRGQSMIAAGTYTALSPFRIHLTQAEIVKSNPVLKRAVIALGIHERPLNYEQKYCSNLKKFYIDLKVSLIKKELEKFTPDELQKNRIITAINEIKSRLRVDLIPNTDIFVINVTGFSPEEAVETANVISRSYTIFDQQQQLAEIKNRYGELHPSVVQLMDNIKRATENLSGETLPDIEAIGTASVKIIEQASSENFPVGKSKKTILAVAFFVAAFLSLALGLTFSFIDQTINSPQDIITHLNLPVIGSIPKKKSGETYFITQDSSKTKYREFYEDLADQLYIFMKTQDINSVLIASPVFNSSQKFISPNIGFNLSQLMGHKTLLIDANLNSPHFEKIYGIDTENNLEKMSIGNNNHLFIKQIENGPDLILTKKTPLKPSTILKRIDLKEIIENLKKDYDLILVDVTSINNMKDVAYVSECTDATVFVINEGLERRQMVKNALMPLQHKDINIIGGILNNRTFPIPGIIYNRL